MAASNIIATHTVTLKHSDGTSSTGVRCQIVPVKTSTILMTGGKALTDILFDSGVDLRDGDQILVTGQDGTSNLGSYTRYILLSYQSVAAIPYLKALVEGNRA